MGSGCWRKGTEDVSADLVCYSVFYCFSILPDCDESASLSRVRDCCCAYKKSPFIDV